MSRICNGCGGTVGRDCFNPSECEYISHQMQYQEQNSGNEVELLKQENAELHSRIIELENILEQQPIKSVPPAIVGARWVKASELKEINWPLCIRYDGGGAPYYTTVCSMDELHKHVSEQNPIDEIEYLHEQPIANSNVNAWVNGKYFKDDWDDFGMYHWRYADDHYKLDTDVFENRQPGFLHKIGGEGFVEYSQIEWLDEAQEQPIKSVPEKSVEPGEILTYMKQLREEKK